MNFLVPTLCINDNIFVYFLSIYKFININSKGNNLFKDIKELECNKYSGIKTNKETYEIFKKILKENNLSIREFFNAIILAIVNSYNGGRE